MVELVKVFGQFVAIVSYATGTVIFSSLLNHCLEAVELLNELHFLLVEGQCVG